MEEGKRQASRIYPLAMVYQVTVRLSTFSPTKTGGGNPERKRVPKAGNRVRDNPCFISGTLRSCKCFLIFLDLIFYMYC